MAHKALCQHCTSLSPKVLFLIAALALAASLSGCATATATKNMEPGPEDRESIRLVVASHMREVRGCYEEAIERRPGAEGKIVVTWEILNNGTAANAQVAEAGPRILEAGDCLIKLINTWTFPKPKTDLLEVRYPFVFSENGN